MNNAHGIFCPYIAVARGKTVRQRPDRVMTDYVAVPCDFLALQKYVTLMSDVCFIYNVAFLVTM